MHMRIQGPVHQGDENRSSKTSSKTTWESDIPIGHNGSRSATMKPRKLGSTIPVLATVLAGRLVKNEDCCEGNTVIQMLPARYNNRFCWQ